MVLFIQCSFTHNALLYLLIVLNKSWLVICICHFQLFVKLYMQFLDWYRSFAFQISKILFLYIFTFQSLSYCALSLVFTLTKSYLRLSLLFTSICVVFPLRLPSFSFFHIVTGSTFSPIDRLTLCQLIRLQKLMPRLSATLWTFPCAWYREASPWQHTVTCLLPKKGKKWGCEGWNR